MIPATCNFSTSSYFLGASSPQRKPALTVLQGAITGLNTQGTLKGLAISLSFGNIDTGLKFKYLLYLSENYFPFHRRLNLIAIGYKLEKSPYIKLVLPLVVSLCCRYFFGIFSSVALFTGPVEDAQLKK